MEGNLGNAELARKKGESVSVELAKRNEESVSVELECIGRVVAVK